MNEEDPARRRAEKYVKDRRDFYYHLMVYVVVNLLLIIFDRRGGTGSNAVLGLDWAYWVILFWGLGLIGHAISVFYGESKVDKVYEQEKKRAGGND